MKKSQDGPGRGGTSDVRPGSFSEVNCNGMTNCNCYSPWLKCSNSIMSNGSCKAFYQPNSNICYTKKDPTKSCEDLNMEDATKKSSSCYNKNNPENCNCCKKQFYSSNAYYIGDTKNPETWENGCKNRQYDWKKINSPSPSNKSQVLTDSTTCAISCSQDSQCNKWQFSSLSSNNSGYGSCDFYYNDPSSDLPEMVDVTEKDKIKYKELTVGERCGLGVSANSICTNLNNNDIKKYPLKTNYPIFQQYIDEKCEWCTKNYMNNNCTKSCSPSSTPADKQVCAACNVCNANINKKSPSPKYFPSSWAPGCIDRNPQSSHQKVSRSCPQGEVMINCSCDSENCKGSLYQYTYNNKIMNFSNKNTCTIYNNNNYRKDGKLELDSNINCVSSDIIKNSYGIVSEPSSIDAKSDDKVIASCQFGQKITSCSCFSEEPKNCKGAYVDSNNNCVAVYNPTTPDKPIFASAICSELL